MLTNFRTVLSQKIQLTADVCLFHFNLLEPKEIIFSAGQYAILKVPSSKGPVSRLYSIASSDTVKNSFELIVEIVPNGLASNYLFNLKENNEIIFQGPAGMFGLKENEREKIFMVTGTGIAPVRSIFISKINPPAGGQTSKTQMKNQKLHLFWGLRSYQSVYLLEELKQLNNGAMEQFDFKICLSREQNLDIIPEYDKKYFELGHIDSCFEKQFNNETTCLPAGKVKQWDNFDFYLCGRRETTESLRLFLINKGVLPENIIFEKF